MQENTELKNKVADMAEKLAASEKLVLQLQKDLNCIVKDKVAFLSLLWLNMNFSGTHKKKLNLFCDFFFLLFWFSWSGSTPFELSCTLITTWKGKVLAFNLGLSKFEKKRMRKVCNYRKFYESTVCK